DLWRRFVESTDLPEDMTALLLDRERVEELTASFPDVGLARMVHACTHTTFAPTVMHGGVKTNVIPDTVDLDLDIRTLPGEGADDVTAMLREALGDLFDQVELVATTDDEASESPMDTPLWDSLSRVTERRDQTGVPPVLRGAGASDRALLLADPERPHAAAHERRDESVQAVLPWSRRAVLSSRGHRAEGVSGQRHRERRPHGPAPHVL